MADLVFATNDPPFDLLAWVLGDGTVHDPLGVLTSWQYWKREAMFYQLGRWSGCAGPELIATCQRNLDAAQVELDAFIEERRAALGHLPL